MVKSYSSFWLHLQREAVSCHSFLSYYASVGASYYESVGASSNRATEEMIPSDRITTLFLKWRLSETPLRFCMRVSASMWSVYVWPHVLAWKWHLWKRGIHYVTKYSRVSCASNMWACLSFSLLTFERSPVLTEGAKPTAFAFWKVHFLDRMYSIPSMLDSFSTLPLVAAICISDPIWEGWMSLWSKSDWMKTYHWTHAPECRSEARTERPVGRWTI